jgi:hypothetical protein
MLACRLALYFADVPESIHSSTSAGSSNRSRPTLNPYSPSIKNHNQIVSMLY